MFSFAMVLIHVHLSRKEQAEFKWSFKLEKVLLTQLSNYFVDRTEEQRVSENFLNLSGQRKARRRRCLK